MERSDEPAVLLRSDVESDDAWSPGVDMLVKNPFQKPPASGSGG